MNSNTDEKSATMLYGRYKRYGFRLGYIFAFCMNTLFSAWLLSGCAEYSGPIAGGDSDSDADTDSDTDTAGDSDTDTAGDADTDSDGDADSDKDTNTDTDAHTDVGCTDVTPCGGDVTGTWTVVTSCLEVSGELDKMLLGLSLNCVASVSGTREVAGTWTGYADGRYSDRTVTSGTETIELSQECVPITGTVVACARMNGPLGSVGYASIDCIESSDPRAWCTCFAVIDQIGGVGAAPSWYAITDGDYITDESTLTSTESEGDRALEYSYCVEENRLTLTPVSTGITGTITGSVVLQQ